MTTNICQIWIVLFGCSAIWFVGRKEEWKRLGYIFGLLSQPAWLYTAIEHKQWGIALLSLWYTYAWSQGVYNYWIRKDEEV
jgi:hypothetical protein